MALFDKVRDLLVRALLTGTDSSNPLQYVQAKVFDGELEGDVEHFEAYGFTSRPHEGAEVYLTHLDGDRSHPIAICITDRRYRVRSLERGEVCIFDSKGRKVFLGRSGIAVEGVSDPVTVHTSSTVTVDAPNTTFTGNVHIMGGLVIDGSTTSAGSLTTQGEITGRGIHLSTHVHSGVESGSSNTGAPV